MIPNAIEQRVIDLIIELHSAGRTLRQIAAELTANNFPTKEGGTTWAHTAVGRILKRKAAA